MSQITQRISKYVELPMFLSSLLAFGLMMIMAISAKAAVSINGAGATFPEPIYTKWFSDYAKKDSSVTINYQGIGSGGGIRQLISGTVDFGASDSPMTAEELKNLGKPVAHIPTVLGAVVVSYNLKLSKPLRLTGEIVADIFSGKITQWNDAKIVAENKDVKLPDLAIIVATRSDGSGTTAVFSEYLSKVSPSWVGKSGKTVKWFDGSMAAKGNSGVAGLIKQNEGTIGYVELIYALENKLAFADIKNKSGAYVTANMKSITAAASKIAKDIEKNDFKVSITDAEGKEAYPISSFTWLLVTESMAKDKGEKMVSFLNWALGAEGQQTAEKLHFAALPKEVQKKALERVKKLQFK